MSLLRLFPTIMCLATSSLLLGQTLQISDDSPKGSPVSLRGTVTFDQKDPNDLACSVTGHNQSAKSIITYAVELDIKEPTGEPQILHFEHDRFFKDLNISLPQTDFPILTDCVVGHERNIPRTPAPPEAHGKLLFVQYDDGSVWGDNETTSEVMRQRADTLAYLQSLKAAYSSGGPSALSQALLKDQPVRTSDHKVRIMVHSKEQVLRHIRDTDGIQAVAKTIDDNLAMAEVRKAALLVP